MSVVQRVDARTFRAVDDGRLLATAKRVYGQEDRWAVSLADGTFEVIDGELVLRVFLGELVTARSDHPNGQLNGGHR